MSQEFGTPLPLRWIFEAPSVRQLARRSTNSSGSRPAAPPSAAPATSDRVRNGCRCRFRSRVLWFLEQFDGPSATYNLADVVRLHGTLDVFALRRALARLLDRHEALRLRFRDDDGVAVCRSRAHRRHSIACCRSATCAISRTASATLRLAGLLRDEARARSI